MADPAGVSAGKDLPEEVLRLAHDHHVETIDLKPATSAWRIPARRSHCEQNIMELSDAKRGSLRTLPLSLTEALDALEKDHRFLLDGGVFDEETIAAWIELKRTEARRFRDGNVPRGATV